MGGNQRKQLSVIQEERSHIHSVTTEANLATDINGSFKNAQPSSIENKISLQNTKKGAEADSVKSI